MKKTYKVDSRCPRGLTTYPEDEVFCKLAVLELKNLRNNKDVPLDKKADFCPWFVNSQSACYCFWVYLQKVLDTRKPISETEMAHLLCTNVDDVKNTEKEALKKVKESELYYELAEKEKEDFF